jgi:hypothetical protein
MYAETYARQKEVTGLTVIIDMASMGNLEGEDARGTNLDALAVDHMFPTPPDAAQAKEEESLFERLLREAVTPEEHTLLGLIDDLVDEAWRFDTGKALRGELRRTFTARGLSERRFYAAFHGIEKRMCL